MDEKDLYPKLRNSIEAFPVEYEGKRSLLLRDRLQLSEELIFPAQLAGFLMLFNGKNSIRDIQAALIRQEGYQLVPAEDISRVAQILDQYYYLDNPNFQGHLAQVEEDFGRSPVRYSSLAGRSYPADPDQLRLEMKDFFSKSGAPEDRDKIPEGKTICGLIAPHIDFDRGGTCYARAYQALGEACQARTFIILGTAHTPTDRHFIATGKDFETPLGRLRTDREMVDELIKSGAIDPVRDEILHRAEHSIEFQCVLLQYLYGEESRDIQIIPILCGPAYKYDAAGQLSIDSSLRETLNMIRSTLSRSARPVCVIASADLAHLGPQFGDPEPVSKGDLEEIGEKDRRMLEYVLKADPEGFLNHILAEGDRRRICGLAPIYALLHLIDSKGSQLIRYDQAYSPQATVTFCSLAFFG